MKNLKIYLKRIILSLAAAAFLLSFSDYTVYADSSSETPEETLESLPEDSYSAEEQVFIDSASDDTDKDLRTLSVEVVRATSSTYSLDDVYNLLISVYTTYTGRASWAVFDQTLRDLIINDFRHYDSNTDSTFDVGQMLWSIRNVMIALQDQFVPATALSSPSIYQLIDAINDTLSLALVDSNNTPYLVNIYNKLVDIASGNIDYTSALFYNSIGVAEYASRINSAIVASYNGLSTQLNKLDDISNKLTTVNTSLQTKLTALNTHAQTIEGKIDNQTSSISSDLSSSGAIASSIYNLQSDFNNISWHEINMTSYSFYDSNLNTLNSFNSETNPGNYFYKINLNTNYKLYKIIIPITGTASNYTFNPNIIIKDFYYLSFTSGNLIKYNNVNYYFTLSNDKRFVCLYILDFPFSASRDVYIEFESLYNFYYFDYNTVYGMDECSDYYLIADFIKQYNELNILSTFKELYASEDLIAAKENQQSYEDQALSDFTGSGSAAASGSDLGNIKNVSSTLKNGLPNQGSVSNALNIFNPNSNLFSDIWAWFSQDNYNNINNPSLRTRDSQIVNFLSQNEDDYYKYLNEGGDQR